MPAPRFRTRSGRSVRRAHSRLVRRRRGSARRARRRKTSLPLRITYSGDQKRAPPAARAGGAKLKSVLRGVLRLRVLGDALAERVALVVVGAVLVLERVRIESTLRLAGLGGVERRLLLLFSQLLRALRDALAEGVG